MAKLMADPLCEDCMKAGHTEAANEAHHILKVATHPELRLDMDNLRSLCKSCHSKRTSRGE